MGTHCYELYGLKLESNQAIIGARATTANGPADIALQCCPPEEFRQTLPDPSFFTHSANIETHVMADGSRLLLVFDLCAIYVAPDGRTLRWTNWRSEPEPPQAYVLSSAISYCLLARGIEPLHGTAVEVGGRALVLLGDSGYGKSTLAAAFTAAGHRLLSDDVLVITRQQKPALGYWLHPGIPRLKLLPDSREAVLPGARGVAMNSATQKELVPIANSHPGPLRVGAMYRLPRSAGRNCGMRIRTISSHAAMLSIIASTFNDDVTDRGRLCRQFEFARELSSAVPVRTIRYPKRHDYLPQVVRALLAD